MCSVLKGTTLVTLTSFYILFRGLSKTLQHDSRSSATPTRRAGRVGNQKSKVDGITAQVVSDSESRRGRDTVRALA